MDVVCQPFYGGRLHKVTGEVKNPAGETVQRVSGEWNASLDFTTVQVTSVHCFSLSFCIRLWYSDFIIVQLQWHWMVCRVLCQC